jgi:hypothetical protein
MARGPITVRVFTVSSLLSGVLASCAPLTRISSQEMVGFLDLIGSMLDSPLSAILWISTMIVSRSSDWRR